MGLVLEWVYGTIVSTAEKSRDGAKRALGVAHRKTSHSTANINSIANCHTSTDQSCGVYLTGLEIVCCDVC